MRIALSQTPMLATLPSSDHLSAPGLLPKELPEAPSGGEEFGMTVSSTAFFAQIDMLAITNRTELVPESQRQHFRLDTPQFLSDELRISSVGWDA
jgi:hypothetical protein